MSLKADIDNLIAQSSERIPPEIKSLMAADKILVLQDGQITESGSHDELLALDGRYAQLWHRQVADAT